MVAFLHDKLRAVHARACFLASKDSKSKALGDVEVVRHTHRHTVWEEGVLQTKTTFKFYWILFDSQHAKCDQQQNCHKFGGSVVTESLHFFF